MLARFLRSSRQRWSFFLSYLFLFQLSLHLCTVAIIFQVIPRLSQLKQNKEEKKGCALMSNLDPWSCWEHLRYNLDLLLPMTPGTPGGQEKVWGLCQDRLGSCVSKALHCPCYSYKNAAFVLKLLSQTRFCGSRAILHFILELFLLIVLCYLFISRHRRG